ncbi:MAG: YihY family inner membrane protein [Gammaproteobacteria bacterium]|nr:YihY family inner membrane protein [Gammaproteobacteria bacterium]
MKYFKIISRFSIFVVQRFIALRCSEIASSLSYTSLLSLVPLLAVIFAAFSSFSVFQELFLEIQHFIFTNFVPSSSELIQEYLNQYVEKASRLTLVGLLGLFVVALMLMRQIDNALNYIWEVSKTKNFVRTFLTYWAVLTLGPILMGISLMLTSYIVSIPIINDTAETIGLRTQMLSTIPIIMTLLAFTITYLIIPNIRVSFLHAFVGGSVATLFFELAKKGFALYISHNTVYSSLYGTLAILPIFLIWIYISWLVTLLGAVTTRSMSLFDFSLQKTSSFTHPFLSAFHILRLLSSAAQKGQALAHSNIYKEPLLHSEKNLEDILKELVSLGWILKVKGNSWVLVKDLDEVSLWNFYQDLPYCLPKDNKEEVLSGIILNSNQLLSQELNFPLKTLFLRYNK